MDSIEQNLAAWRASLIIKMPLGGLHTRSPVVYKWKATFRSWMLRETTFWRVTDLMTQSYELHKKGQGLSARILLRSGYETLATLIYLNQITQKVLDGALDFHIFSKSTSQLLLGSKNQKEGPISINIITVLGHGEKQYPGLSKIYSDLSESAHHSYQGLCAGYSKFDHIADEVTFSNRWIERYGAQHLNLMDICMKTYHREYQATWSDLIVKLEQWVETYDTDLESTKPGL